MNTIWIVYHEWRENIEEYATWHINFHAAFTTEELALKYVENRPHNDDCYCISEQIIYDFLPDFVIRTEPEERNI